MDVLNVLIVIGLIHCSLFFFDTIFKTCSHYPYLYLLKNTGLEVQVLRIKWFTTAFNRKVIKWGMDRTKFWTAWFNVGAIVSVILLPLATIAILKMTFNIWTSGPSLDKNNNLDPLLEPMIPGVNVSLSDMGYYIIALTICSIVHEFGHALAAVTEYVQLFGLGILIAFTVPMAFVHLSSEQLSSLPLKNQLRVACAGVWHNTVLAALAATIVMLSSWLWAPLYVVGNGIYVKSILPNSPVIGPTGLFEQDIIYEINNCPVKTSEDWYNCILKTIDHPALGYCVKQSFIQEYDESVPSRQKTNGVINCCTSDSENNGNLCFEYIEGPQAAPLHLPPHSCLPARIMINQSQNFCHSSHECIFHDTHCLKPSLDNVTKIVQIRRKVGKDVLFFGHPADIYRTVDVSDWIPKYSFLTSKLPESFILLCKYITILSGGQVVINIMPCFFLDGQYIINILILYLLNFTPHNKNIRQTVMLTITSIGTLLLIINMFYLLVNKVL